VRLTFRELYLFKFLPFLNSSLEMNSQYGSLLSQSSILNPDNNSNNNTSTSNSQSTYSILANRARFKTDEDMFREANAQNSAAAAATGNNNTNNNSYMNDLSKFGPPSYKPTFNFGGGAAGGLGSSSSQGQKQTFDISNLFAPSQPPAPPVAGQQSHPSSSSSSSLFANSQNMPYSGNFMPGIFPPSLQTQQQQHNANVNSSNPFFQQPAPFRPQQQQQPMPQSQMMMPGVSAFPPPPPPPPHGYLPPNPSSSQQQQFFPGNANGGMGGGAGGIPFFPSAPPYASGNFGSANFGKTRNIFDVNNANTGYPYNYGNYQNDFSNNRQNRRLNYIQSNHAERRDRFRHHRQSSSHHDTAATAEDSGKHGHRHKRRHRRHRNRNDQGAAAADQDAQSRSQHKKSIKSDTSNNRDGESENKSDTISLDASTSAALPLAPTEAKGEFRAEDLGITNPSLIKHEEQIQLSVWQFFSPLTRRILMTKNRMIPIQSIQTVVSQACHHKRLQSKNNYQIY
jgi:hypothetical protein